MPVYLHIYNLIIPKNLVAEKYQGGINQFIIDFRFGDFIVNQEDDELFSFGQMNWDCLPIDELVDKGIHYDYINQNSEDFAVIYRYGDDFWKSPWIQHNRVFAWHINSDKNLIRVVGEISSLTWDEIKELIDSDLNALKVIRMNI